MNKLIKFFRDITGNYKTVTRKETRYEALIKIGIIRSGRKIDNDITAILRDYRKILFF